MQSCRLYITEMLLLYTVFYLSSGAQAAEPADNFTALAGRRGSSYVGYTWNHDPVAVLRTVETKLSDYVNVMDFAAPELSPYDGTSDFTAAFTEALARGLFVHIPRGKFTIKRPLYIPNPGQRLVGEGVGATALRIPSDFSIGTIPSDITTPGVIIVTNPSGGPDYVDGSRSGVDGFSMIFEHASLTSRSALTHFPWAITTYVTRPYIGDVIIEGAWNGIWTNIKAGGMIGGTWEIGAYGRGLWIDGPQDTVHINTIRFWPYGCDTSIYFDGSTFGATFGTIDGMQINGLFTIGPIIEFVPGTRNYGPFGTTIAQFHIDSAINTVRFAAGQVEVASGYLTGGISDTFAVYVNCPDDNFLSLNNMWIAGPNSGTHSFVQIDGGNLMVSGAFVSGQNNPNAATFAHTGGKFHLSNVIFHADGAVARSTPFIYISGGSATLSDIRFPSAGGTGNAVEILNDNYHSINLANTGTWSVLLPYSRNIGTYYAPKLRPVYSGDLNSEGAAIVAHGLAHIQVDSIQSATVWTQTNSGVKYVTAPYSIIQYIDYANIRVDSQGAAPNGRYRVELNLGY